MLCSSVPVQHLKLQTFSRYSLEQAAGSRIRLCHDIRPGHTHTLTTVLVIEGKTVSHHRHSLAMFQLSSLSLSHSFSHSSLSRSLFIGCPLLHSFVLPLLFSFSFSPPLIVLFRVSWNSLSHSLFLPFLWSHSFPFCLLQRKLDA